MTANELLKKFNDGFGLKEWPKTYEVDGNTYANCCQSVFDWAEEMNQREILEKGYGDLALRKIHCGEHNGLMFKNVELILMEKK